MYTNGYTGQQSLSLITVTNAPKGYQVYTEAEFAAASEHITLQSLEFRGMVVSRTDNGYSEFTGV